MTSEKQMADVLVNLMQAITTLSDERNDLLNALQQIVSAQHAGPITVEMYHAWEDARKLLKKIKESEA